MRARKSYSGSSLSLIREGAFQRALQAIPSEGRSDKDSGLLRAACYSGLNEFQAAIQELQTIVGIAPCFEDYYNMGNAYQASGDLKRALKAYSAALRYAGSQVRPDLYNNIGCAFFEVGNFALSERCFLEAISLRPGFAKAHYNLGCVLSCFQTPSPAIKCFRTAIACDPTDALSLYQLALLHLIGGQKDASLRLVEELRALEGAEHLVSSYEYVSRFSDSETKFMTKWDQTLRVSLERNPTEGDIYEFGVLHGRSARVIAKYAGNSRLVGFDSLQGLSTSWHDVPKGAYSTAGELPDVPSNMSLEIGWFAATIPRYLANNKNPSIRMIHVDCDTYEATVDIFAQIGQHIKPGTIIVFDDFIGNPSWEEDEAAAFAETIGVFRLEFKHVVINPISKQVVIQII